MAPTHSFMRSSLAMSLSLIAITDARHAHRRHAHGPGLGHGHGHPRYNRAETTTTEEQMFSILPFPAPIETDKVVVDDSSMSIQAVPQPEETGVSASIVVSIDASASAEASFSIQTIPNPVETSIDEEEQMFSILPFPNPIETINVSDEPMMSIQTVPNPTEEPTIVAAPVETFDATPIPLQPVPAVLSEPAILPTPVVISAPGPSPPSAGAALVDDIQQIEAGLNALPNDLLSFVMAMQDRLQGLEDLLSSLVSGGMPVATQPVGVVTELPVATEAPEPTITEADTSVESNTYGPPPPGYTSLCRPAGAGPLVPCPTRSTLTSTSRITSTLTYNAPVPVGTGNATYGNGSTITQTLVPAPPGTASITSPANSTPVPLPSPISVGLPDTSMPPVPLPSPISVDFPDTPVPLPSPISVEFPEIDYTFNASSEDNVAVYYGQSEATEAGGLLSLCTNPNVDIISLAFLFSFHEPRGYPSIDFGPGCTGPNAAQAFQAPGLSDCATLAPDIQACQNIGKKILVSLGGEGSNTSFTSDDQAMQLASTLWNLFGAGTGEAPALRPFGPDIVIDGFDIDNENQNTSSYNAFATALRSEFAQDDSKTYYLSTAPDCPIPDPSIPLGAMALSDFVWVQFWDNPSCELGSDGFQDSFAAWSELLSSSNNRTDGVPPMLFVGAAAWDGVESGYIEGAALAGQVALVRELYVENFGGLMLWDGSEGLENLDQYEVSYLQYAKNALH